MSENRRKDKRASVNLRVRWDGISGHREARIGDIAMGGCFVDSMSRVELDEVLSLEIELPSGQWLPVRGKVTTYQEGVGFGMEFTFLSEDEESQLKELLG